MTNSDSKYTVLINPVPFNTFTLSHKINKDNQNEKLGTETIIRISSQNSPLNQKSHNYISSNI